MYFALQCKKFRSSANFSNASDNTIAFNANIVKHRESRFVSAPFVKTTVGIEL